MLTEIIQSDPALQALQAAWQALSAVVPQSTGFFASWDFVWQYTRAIQPKGWFVVTIRDPDTRKLVAVFAWERVNLHTATHAYRAVQPMGASLGSYIEPPIAPRCLRPAMQALFNTALRAAGVDLVCFWPLHETSPLYNALNEDLRGSGTLKTFRYPDNLREIETRGLDYALYCSSRPGATIPDARYGERRLNREGTLHFTLCEPGPEAVEIVQRLCTATVERFGAQFAYRAQPEWKTLVVGLVRALAPCGTAQVSTLRFNGAIIASGLSFWHKGRRFFYLTHYDPVYARYSPGKILLYRLIEQTFADRGVFCFGSGTYRYKDDWAQSSGELKAAFVFLQPEVRQALDALIDRDFIVRLAG